MGIKIHKVYATKWYATLIVCYNKRLFFDSYCVGKGEVRSSILRGSTIFPCLFSSVSDRWVRFCSMRLRLLLCHWVAERLNRLLAAIKASFELQMNWDKLPYFCHYEEYSHR